MRALTASPAPLPWAGFCRWCARAVSACGLRGGERARFEADPVCAWCRALVRAGADGAGACVPVVQGTAVGVVSTWGTVCELALLPFSYERGGFSWEFHDVVRAGDPPARLRAPAELAAVCDVVGEPDVRVVSLASCRDPIVSARLGCNGLLVALRPLEAGLAGELFPAVAAPASFPALRVVDLESIPWAGAFGRALFPLDDFLRAEGLSRVVGSEEACRHSALRQAALVARLLELAAGGNLFERWLLAGRRPAPDDSSDGSSDEVV